MLPKQVPPAGPHVPRSCLNWHRFSNGSNCQLSFRGSLKRKGNGMCHTN